MWTYDPHTRTTGQKDGLIPRVRLEDAIDKLKPIIHNRSQMVDVLTALSGLSWNEVAFNVDMLVEPSIEQSQEGSDLCPKL